MTLCKLIEELLGGQANLVGDKVRLAAAGHS